MDAFERASVWIGLYELRVRRTLYLAGATVRRRGFVAFEWVKMFRMIDSKDAMLLDTKP